jgi:transposase
VARVVIGVDPHKASNTLVVIDAQERIVAQQRFANDRVGYRSMKSFARAHRDRVWAVEGARGVGAGLAQRLVAEGEPVLDVPARLSARVRALGGGSGRKTDDADAFAVAVAGLRARALQVVRRDDTTEILRMLTTRRQEVVELRIATVNRLHVVLCQLIPGGAKRHLSAARARSLLSAVRPRDAVGKARKQLALDYTRELERLDARLKELKKSIADVLDEHPTTLLDINGVGPINAAKILAEVGDVRRFPGRHHFASYTGTAPVDVSSGDNNRHRLNRGGNRRLNHALHIAAVVQYRMPGPGHDYYRRKRDQGKTHLEALRCLKRRLSDIAYRHLVDDLAAASPGGQVGASLQSSAADLIPMASFGAVTSRAHQRPYAHRRSCVLTQRGTTTDRLGAGAQPTRTTLRGGRGGSTAAPLIPAEALGTHRTSPS